MRYPDFLCIGLPKSGTTWLYHHLRSHEHVWLPPVKELAYMWGYDRRHYSKRRLLAHRKYVFGKKKRLLAECLKGMWNSDNKGSSELRWYLHYSLFPQTKWWYQNLFPFGNDKLRGDISPQYHVFTRDEIAKVHKLNPNLKIILILRDPVDRLWSFARMKMVSSGKLNHGMVSAQDWKIKIDEEIGECPDYLEIINRWSAYFSDNMLVSYYDELVDQPKVFLNNILNFLGLPEREVDESVLKNKVWKGVDLDMSDDIEQYLIDQNIQNIRFLKNESNSSFVKKWLDNYELKREKNYSN